LDKKRVESACNENDSDRRSTNQDSQKGQITWRKTTEKMERQLAIHLSGTTTIGQAIYLQKKKEEEEYFVFF
jgi:hypothetical protein